MSSKDFTSIPYSGYGAQGLQVFTPKDILSVTAGGSLDTVELSAIRVAAEVSYQLNGTGAIATMPIGCTGISKGITSLKFVDAVVIEVM